jgi:hypothetical protein
MTAKIDGTNGLLQAYDYQIPVTGFSYTFSPGTQVLIMNPAGTLASGAIFTPAAPNDGMTITFSTSQQIKALSLYANSGQTLTGGITTIPAGRAMTYMYNASTLTWYPMGTVTTNLGYIGLPQNAQNPGYTLTITDAGYHIYFNSAGAFTIPSNADVPFPIGTAVTFVNLQSSSSITINSDTMYLASTGTTGTRTLASYGVATALKVAATTWIISGSGLT